MKEKIIKLLKNIFLICMLCNLCFFKTNAEEKSFTGSRVVEFKVDQSDLENFINGGRSVFDFVIRKNVPAWLNYQLKTIGRDSYLLLDFEFNSYDDYCLKLEELLRYCPSVVWIEENETSLIENFTTFELLNLVNEGLLSSGCLLEKTSEELFTAITTDKIILNGKEYEVENRVDIRPETKELIKFDAVDVSTIGKNDGTYERKIVVEIKSASEQGLSEKIINRFRQVAEVNEEQISDTEIKVTAEFMAYNYEELIRKTMVCLNAATSIQETEEYVDDMTVKVKRVEFFDLPSLLMEDGRFTYSYEFPDYYQNVICEQNNNANINETSINSNNESYVEFTYEKGFHFDEIEIYSDFSDCLGKKTRSIKLSKDVKMAQLYHDVIKAELSSKLEKGMILDIYDEDGKRYYEISYSSYLLRELEEFSGTIFDSVCRIDVSESWIPFGNSVFKENILINDILPEMSPAKETIVSYKFFPLSNIQDIEKDTVIIADDLVTYKEGNSILVNINYRALNLIKCIMEVLGLMLVIGIVIIICIKIKRIINKKKQSKIEGTTVTEEIEEKMPKGEKIETERICPQCSNVVGTEAKFCGKCGMVLYISKIE